MRRLMYAIANILGVLFYTAIAIVLLPLWIICFALVAGLILALLTLPLALLAVIF